MKKFVVILAMVASSVNVFADSLNPYTVKELDQLTMACMVELVLEHEPHQSLMACAHFEEIKQKMDSEEKVKQCAIDRTRIIHPIEVEGCKVKSQMSVVLGASQSPLSDDECHQVIREQFCN